MTTHQAIAKALRDNGLTACTSIWVSHTNITNSIRLTEPYPGYVFARRFVQAGRGYSRDRSKEILSILMFIGCSYVEGNDAPKGGKLGSYIMYHRDEFISHLKARTGYDLAAVEFEAAQALKAAIEAVNAEQKAVFLQANEIRVDEAFYDAVIEARKFIGKERMNADRVAMRDLLRRSGYTLPLIRFWETFRILKSRALEIYKPVIKDPGPNLSFDPF